MPLTSTRPSDAPPERGNKTKRRVRDGEGRVFTQRKRFIKKEEQGSRRVKAEGDEFRAERRRPYGRPVGRRAAGLVSANPSLGPRLTAKSSRTPYLNPARRAEERRCCGSEGQVCQMSTFSGPATVVANAHGNHGTRRGGGWLVVWRGGAGQVADTGSSMRGEGTGGPPTQVNKPEHKEDEISPSFRETACSSTVFNFCSIYSFALMITS